MLKYGPGGQLPDEEKAGRTHLVGMPGSRDSDGDGIPDHDDWCPKKRSSESGWISGLASDFDGDGCEDGTIEDVDKDNDGVEDEIDRCPLTPGIYKFVSNSVSDFDGDGCADGVEDHDDDGDGVWNSFDECQRTLPGDSSDSSGCSRIQRELVSKAHRPVQQQVPEVKKSSTDNELPPAFALTEWASTIRSAWVEVLLGAALTPVLHTLKELLTSIRGTVSGAALQGRAQGNQRPPGWSLLMRCSMYCMFFFIVYGLRAFQNGRWPWLSQA